MQKHLYFEVHWLVLKNIDAEYKISTHELCRFLWNGIWFVFTRRLFKLDIQVLNIVIIIFNNYCPRLFISVWNEPSETIHMINIICTLYYLSDVTVWVKLVLKWIEAWRTLDWRVSLKEQVGCTTVWVPCHFGMVKGSWWGNSTLRHGPFLKSTVGHGHFLQWTCDIEKKWHATQGVHV
jgi:hypothetical protein